MLLLFIFISNLNFQSHISQILTKLTSGISLLRNLSFIRKFELYYCQPSLFLNMQPSLVKFAHSLFISYAIGILGGEIQNSKYILSMHNKAIGIIRGLNKNNYVILTGKIFRF